MEASEERPAGAKAYDAVTCTQQPQRFSGAPTAKVV